MHEDGGPDYLEAFHALEMVHATKVQNRSRWVTWFDENRREVGWGKVTWRNFQLEFAFQVKVSGTPAPYSGRRLLVLEPVARGSHSFRFHALCRTCGKYVYRLFYRTGDWLCKDCQHLRNRSTFLPPQLRWQEEYDGLRYEIADGRPPGMREKLYAQKLQRIAELKPRLDGSRRRPGPEFYRLVFAEWSDKDPNA